MSHTNTRSSVKTVNSKSSSNRGRGKTNCSNRNYFNRQQTDEEHCKDNVDQEQHFKSHGFVGNNYRGQCALRGNRNFDRHAKRPLSSSSRSSAAFDCSKQANNNSAEKHRNTLSLKYRLPKHFQNPIFVDKFLPRFSSMLHPTKLLAPETSVANTPRTVYNRGISDHSKPSLVSDQINATLHYYPSKSPHKQVLTCDLNISSQPRSPLLGDSFVDRARSFDLASNGSSQVYENSHLKNPHRSFPTPYYNLPSIPLLSSEPDYENKTFASISSIVSNRFRKNTNNCSYERPSTSASFDKKQSGARIKTNRPGETNKMSVFSLDSPSHTVEDSYSHSLQENRLHSNIVLENGSNRNQIKGGAQHREDLSKVTFKNSKFGKVPVEDPNLFRSSFQNNHEHIQSNVLSDPSESNSSRSVSKLKSKTAVTKNNLINATKQFDGNQEKYPKENTNISTGFQFHDQQNAFPNENRSTSASTSTSKPGGFTNFSLGSTLLSQLDVLESHGQSNGHVLKAIKTNVSNNHNSGLLKPDNKDNQKSNYSNKNESKLLSPAVAPTECNKAVSLRIPRQAEVFNGVNCQRSLTISNENDRDSVSECDKLNEVLLKNNNRSFSSTEPCENLGLTDYTLTGQSFNIRQPARDLRHRAPSRTEVLERIEAEYAVKALEHAEKERLKEAKKRDEYLAKYKYIDQGHKLYEGYLDEAVGYDPNFHLSEEGARQRQQQRIAEDALLYQEREREKNEKQKKRDEEKTKKMLEKNMYVNPGYKLGRNDNKDFQDFHKNLAKTKDLPVDSAEPNSTAFDFEIPTAADCMVEGQSMQEALELQQQILQEAAKLKLKETSLKKQPSTSRMPPQISQRQDTSDQRNPVYKTATNPVAKESTKAPKLNEIQFIKSLPATNILPRPNQNIQFLVKTAKSNSVTNEKLLPKLEKLVPQNDGSPKPKESSIANQVQDAENLMNPVSCVLDKPTKGGPVLVLRPTNEALQRALASHLEIQDEMDKRGYSTLYKPTVEKALFVHNKFERKSLDKIDTDFGAICKQKETVQPQVIVACSDQVKASGEPEPVIDLQAEMRAARLKMQQKYEETLKKQQVSFRV